MSDSKNDGVFHIEININMPDPLAVARMNLAMGAPAVFTSYCEGVSERYMQTPWQYYSALYKRQYGIYPQMFGYKTLIDESEEKTPF